MCGRFDLDRSNQEIDRLIAELPPDSHPVKLGEVFPSNTALTLILEEGRLAPRAMAWGFPRWDGKGVIFNARAESVLQKPMFRNALKRNPAIIPVSGFYEWRENPLSGHKERFRFTAPDASLLYLAGFWSKFPKEELEQHFTIITTDANASMRPYHDRMPLLLPPEQLAAWLNGQSRAEMLASEPFALSAEPG